MELNNPNTIRILIVDDNKATVENVTRLLSFEPDMEVIGSAGSGREGVEKARVERPDIVMMDINMPDMDGIEACRRIGQIAPGSRVMMMSVQGDMAYFKRAMNAGAREFLTKPFDFDEMIHSIRRVYEAEATPAERAAIASESLPADLEEQIVPIPEKTKGALIAVFGPKGGIGSSTIAANLAIALRGGRQSRVLLVDGDLAFGDLSALMDLQPRHNILDVLQKADADDLDLVKQMQTNHFSGVQVLAAPVRPELAELVQPKDFKALLESLRDLHDYIVIDMGTKYTEMARQVLDQADRVIFVVTPEVTTIKNSHLILGMGYFRNYAVDKVLPVLNRYNELWGLTPEMVGRAIGRPVALVIPEDDAAAISASNQGRPVLLSAPRSPMVKQLLTLEKLLPAKEHLAKEPVEAPSKNGKEPTLISKPVLEQPEIIEIVEREGCLRWIPFLQPQL